MKTQQFEEQERSAVQEIACQERTHYTTFAACLKPLIVEQVAMLREVEQLDGVMDKLNQIIADPFNKLSSSEEILSFVKVREYSHARHQVFLQQSHQLSFCEGFRGGFQLRKPSLFSEKQHQLTLLFTSICKSPRFL